MKAYTPRPSKGRSDRPRPERKFGIHHNFLTISSAVLLGLFAAWASHLGHGDTNSAYFAFVGPGLVVFVSSLVYGVLAIVYQSAWPIAALMLMMLLRYTI